MAKKWLEFRQNSINRKKREFRYAEFTFLAPIPRFYAELNSAAGFASGIRVNYGYSQTLIYHILFRIFSFYHSSDLLDIHSR